MAGVTIFTLHFVGTGDGSFSPAVFGCFTNLKAAQDTARKVFRNFTDLEWEYDPRDNVIYGLRTINKTKAVGITQNVLHETVPFIKGID